MQPELVTLNRLKYQGAELLKEGRLIWHLMEWTCVLTIAWALLEFFVFHNFIFSFLLFVTCPFMSIQANSLKEKLGEIETMNVELGRTQVLIR